eukprot:CAMPEP_0172549634 /NCGR_PEP_ID=MMETSP1067-20121228/18993_1 /TAXON_ID=265564 ORGANISM="Thalassiosira punctigera, Strain Tpunct2005C2" /NCGR_SAMPLE_ID=MMETSP1067 /ASSEMBLY_ACC=CAM_ASM_000444 /LENGTH=59 /DNA_ID=CAMNT_0013337033 /DNA_START=54 /DNA_END=229 /DNA_ORIENTATION=+
MTCGDGKHEGATVPHDRAESWRSDVKAAPDPDDTTVGSACHKAGEAVADDEPHRSSSKT